MTTGWPMCFCRSGATGRKMLSVSPPASHGTIILMGRSGYAANAASGAAATSAARINFLIFYPPPRRPDNKGNLLPQSYAMFPGKWYDEVKIGERFGTSVTVTETHLVLGSGMFGDFNPLHVDEEFSRNSIFGGRILHGPFTSALVSAPVGMYFSGTAIAY